MAKDEHERTFLERENYEFLSNMARYYMLDAIACEMHNEGYGLDGNRAENDTLWLARSFYDATRGARFNVAHWDNLSDEERAEYIKQAEVIMRLIPQLMSRISDRCVRISKAVRTSIKAEKLDEWYRENEAHPARRRF
jgi:hypothetical protein